jgi:Uma2 family endonuclease
MISVVIRANRIVRGVHLPFSRNAEQTMGMPAVQTDSAPHRGWTPAQVRELIDESRAWPRYELIGGELIVTPSPGWPHQIAVTEIVVTLANYLKVHHAGVAICSPADLELKPKTITQPDIFVTPRRIQGNPDEVPSWADIKGLALAIEVISPSSVRIDRIVKRDFYLDAGVAEYWIVDLDARMIERWRPSQETPEVLRVSLEWKPEGADSPLIIDLIGLFEGIWSKHWYIMGR